MTLQNAISTPFAQTFLSNAMIANPSQRQIIQMTQSLTLNGSGFLNFYNVPSGYKAIVIGITITNISGSTLSNLILGLEYGGTGSGQYIQMTNGLLSIANNVSTSTALRYIFNTGDNIGLGGGTALAAINVSMQILLLPNTFPATSYNHTSFSGTGFYDTIYTVPSNTQSIIVSTSNANLSELPPSAAPLIFVSNRLGLGTQSYNAFLVPSGDSPSSNNQITVAQTVGSNTTSALIAVGTTLTTAATTIQVETTTGSFGGPLQAMFFTVFEFPT